MPTREEIAAWSKSASASAGSGSTSQNEYLKSLARKKTVSDASASAARGSQAQGEYNASLEKRKTTEKRTTYGTETEYGQQLQHILSTSLAGQASNQIKQYDKSGSDALARKADDLRAFAGANSANSKMVGQGSGARLGASTEYEIAKNLGGFKSDVVGAAAQEQQQNIQNALAAMGMKNQEVQIEETIRANKADEDLTTQENAWDAFFKYGRDQVDPIAAGSISRDIAENALGRPFTEQENQAFDKYNQGQQQLQKVKNITSSLSSIEQLAQVQEEDGDFYITNADGSREVLDSAAADYVSSLRISATSSLDAGQLNATYQNLSDGEFQNVIDNIGVQNLTGGALVRAVDAGMLKSPKEIEFKSRELDGEYTWKRRNEWVDPETLKANGINVGSEMAYNGRVYTVGGYVQDFDMMEGYPLYHLQLLDADGNEAMVVSNFDYGIDMSGITSWEDF